MPSDIKSMALVVCATMAAACSGTPPAAADAGAAPPGAVDTRLVKAGYSVMRRSGEVYYCRNEIITGQRIGTRICLTAGQIQDEKQNVTKAKDMLDQPSYQCLGAACKN